MSEKDMDEAQSSAEENPSVEEQNEAGENIVDIDSNSSSADSELAAAQKKAEENWDKLVRSQAELENLKRRHERDLEHAHKYALEKFANGLLPVIDSLEMGIQAAGAEGTSLESLREGAEMTLKMFADTITKFGIESIHPVDEPFNPELHQAMAMVDCHDKPANMVMNVMQKGYLLNERLIRPAMVTVSKQPAETKNDAETDEKGTNIDEKA